jgi:hypothetical protein
MNTTYSTRRVMKYMHCAARCSKQEAHTPPCSVHTPKSELLGFEPRLPAVSAHSKLHGPAQGTATNSRAPSTVRRPTECPPTQNHQQVLTFEGLTWPLAPRARHNARCYALVLRQQRRWDNHPQAATSSNSHGHGRVQALLWSQQCSIDQNIEPGSEVLSGRWSNCWSQPTRFSALFSHSALRALPRVHCDRQ